MSEPGFWDDQDTARDIMSEASDLKRVTGKLSKFQCEIEDLQVLVELYDESGDDPDTLTEVEQSAAQLAEA
ncbi:uncharacterized protein METZ01_LOCUS451078, partial [marine metagenome]